MGLSRSKYTTAEAVNINNKLTAQAEQLFADARAAAAGVGGTPTEQEASAMTLLLTALAMSIVDIAGPNLLKLAAGLAITQDMLSEVAAPLWVERQEKKGS